MKKVFVMVMMMVMMATTFAMADTYVNWNVEVSGLEVTHDETEFIKDGYDLVIVVVPGVPGSGVGYDKMLIRFTDDEENNYSEAFETAYDDYGYVIEQGRGHIGEDRANCRMKDGTVVVRQLEDYINEKYPETKFEFYVYENK